MIPGRERHRWANRRSKWAGATSQCGRRASFNRDRIWSESVWGAHALACWFWRLAATTDAKRQPGFQTNFFAHIISRL